MVLKIADCLRNLHREEKGFTLIELLIVIAIIAVIAAIAIPMVASRIDDARESADRANVRNLQSLADQYYVDKGEYPGTYETPTDDVGVVVGDDWIDDLKGSYLHEEGVDSPYPDTIKDSGEPGYTLTVKKGAKKGALVGTVTSTETDRWKEE